jgi:hypothetical protein
MTVIAMTAVTAQRPLPLIALARSSCSHPAAPFLQLAALLACSASDVTRAAVEDSGAVASAADQVTNDVRQDCVYWPRCWPVPSYCCCC